MSERLLEEQFTKAADHGRKMNPTTLEWARAVLVHGRRATEVAKTAGVSKQRVHQACKQILTRHVAVTTQEHVPTGWRSVAGVLPSSLADRFDDLQADISKFLRTT